MLLNKLYFIFQNRKGIKPNARVEDLDRWQELWLLDPSERQSKQQW